jgi:hypothetical protein
MALAENDAEVQISSLRAQRLADLAPVAPPVAAPARRPADGARPGRLTPCGTGAPAQGLSPAWTWIFVGGSSRM